MCWMQVIFIPGKEGIVSCLDGSFSGVAGGISPVRHRGGGHVGPRARPHLPTYERHCVRGRGHDGRDEIHKNGKREQNGHI